MKLPKLPVKIPFLAKPKKDVVGVDIGSSSIQIVQLKESAGKWTLIKYAQAPIILDTSKGEVPPAEKKAIASSILKKLLLDNKITVHDAATSVSGNSVIVRYVKFAKLTQEQLEKTIQFEAEPYIPFPIAEVNIGFQILGDISEEGTTKMETILVAAKKEVIQNKYDILLDAGLRPVVVDVDAFCIENELSLNVPADAPPETILSVNIGSSTTNLSIIDNGVSRVVRDIFVAGNNFTKALQRNLQMDIKTAEQAKTNFGIIATPEEKEEALSKGKDEALQISNVLCNCAKDIVSEIERSIVFYHSQVGEKPISRILISGGIANMKGLDKFIGNELKIPVEHNNPFSRIAPPGILPSEDAKMVEFAVATGLATRRFGDTITKGK